MSTLKYTTDAGCHSPRQTLAGASARHVTKPDKSPRSGGSLPGQAVYVHSVNTKQKQNVVGPSIRALRMRNGWSQASLATRLKMAGWNCSRSRLAKIECGLITVRDRDLPHFLNVFATNIEALYPARLLSVVILQVVDDRFSYVLYGAEPRKYSSGQHGQKAPTLWTLRRVRRRFSSRVGVHLRADCALNDCQEPFPYP